MCFQLFFCDCTYCQATGSVKITVLSNPLKVVSVKTFFCLVFFNVYLNQNYNCILLKLLSGLSYRSEAPMNIFPFTDSV
jgi:hypothetical protein